MTQYLAPIMFALAFATGLAPSAHAHSLEELESRLVEREAYFQGVDEETPDFALQDPGGGVTRLADFAGKVVVLHFIYTSYPDVCPLHAERIAEIQAMVNQTPMKEQVQFITITTDPKDDTPEVLREFGKTHGLDRVNWLFLTAAAGQPEAVTRDLVQAFGHRFTETDDGTQLHGVVTHVIDKQGRWRANFHGLKFEPTNLVLFVNALVNESTTSHDHDDTDGVLDWLWDLFGQSENRWSGAVKS